MNHGKQEIECIFQQFCEAAPNLKRLQDVYGTYSMMEYLQIMLTSHQKGHSYTDCPIGSNLKSSFYRACRNYAEPIIGSEKTCEMLRMFDTGIISTANHMGVDTIGAQLQGNILFGAMMRPLRGTNSAIPLLAAATVPLTNSTFPKGFTFRNQSGQLMKLPFYSGRYNTHFVLNAPALCPKNIAKVERQLTEFKDCYLQETVRSVLDQYFYAEALLSLPDYPQQITWLNYKISGGLVPGDSMQFIYLPMEKIASDIMVEQIADKNSPVYAMLFDPAVRKAMLAIIGEDSNLPKTDYFWGIGSNGSKRFLTCDEDYWERGSHGNGEKHFYSFNHPEAITEGLLSGTLIPTTYLSIMILMLSGAMHQTIGGYFCIDYFQALKKALAALFQIAYGYVPAYLMEQGVIYLCGPSVIGFETNHAIYSAGLLEVLYAGGIAREQLDDMLEISWKNSHLLSLQETIFDLIPEMRTQSAQKATGLRGIISEHNLIYKV